MRTAIRMALAGGCAASAIGLLSGCDDYKEVKGADLSLPSVVRAGTPFAVTVSGQLDSGAECPTRYTAESELKLATAESILAETQPGATGDAKIKAFNTILAANRGSNVDQKVSGVSGTPCRLGNRTTSFVVKPQGSKPQTVKFTAAVYGKKPGTNQKQTRSTVQKEITVLPPAAPQPAQKAPTQPVANPGAPKATFIVDYDPALTDSIVNGITDARQSSDPDGHIASYSWDLDGNGTYGDAGETGPRAEIATAPAGATTQTIGLRVTDDAGNTAQTTKTIQLAASTDADYLGGYFSFSDPDAQPGQSITIRPSYYQGNGSPVKVQIDTDGDGTYDVTQEDAQGNEMFPVTYGAGIHEVAVRFTELNKRPLVARKLIVVDSVTGNARRGATASAKTAKSLSLGLKLSKGRIARRGRVQFDGPNVTARGTVLKGRVKGSVPKGAARKVRRGLKVLTSGRFAVKLTGSARAVGTGLEPRGKSTMVVRSGRSVVCLAIKQSATAGTFRIVGATGKAEGLTGSGSLVPISFGDGTTPVIASIAPKKGKAKGLSKTCRALATQAR